MASKREFENEIPQSIPLIISRILNMRVETANIFFILLITFLAASVYLVALFLKYAFMRRKLSKLLPGVKVRFFNFMGDLRTLPFSSKTRLGNNEFVALEQHMSGFAELFRKEKLFAFWLTYLPVIVLLKAEAIEEVTNKAKLNDKHGFYEWADPWIGTGLLTSNGKKWKARRKLLTPCFHMDILKDFVKTMNVQSETLVKVLRKETKKDFTLIHEPISLFTLDVICETTLGVCISAQENNELDYVLALKGILGLFIKRALNVFQWPDFLFYPTKNGREFKKHVSTIHNFTRSVIQMKKNEILNGKKKENQQLKSSKAKSLMDLLLEHHLKTKDFEEEDVMEEVNTFAVAGNDTTATTTTWVLYLIGLHRDVQTRISEELDQIFGDDMERPITQEDIKEMKYLDCVIKESTRLYPPLPILARKVPREVQICGYPIPKEAIVILPPYHLHRDREVFPNPEKFDPDRFLPENCIKRNPYAFIPFSVGPRNCIGQKFAVQEMKIAIASILRNFTLESLDPRDKIILAVEFLLRPENPLRVRIRPRQTS